MVKETVKTGKKEETSTKKKEEKKKKTLDEILSPIFKKYLTQVHEGNGNGAYAQAMNSVEKPLLTEALKLTKGNQVQAASLLGINRNTLRRKISLHKIKV